MFVGGALRAPPTNIYHEDPSYALNFWPSLICICLVFKLKVCQSMGGSVSLDVDQSIQGWINQSKCGSVSPRLDPVQQQVDNDVCYGVFFISHCYCQGEGGWRWRATGKLLPFSKYIGLTRWSHLNMWIFKSVFHQNYLN